jgi:hypothetical protein
MSRADSGRWAEVFVRVAQWSPALAATAWFNWQLGLEDKRCLLAYGVFGASVARRGEVRSRAAKW